MKKILIGLLLCGLVTAMSGLALAQDKTDQSQILKVPAGTKKKLSGVILDREADNITLRDQTGGDYIIALTGSTKVEEKKGNPFRGSKKYAVTQLQQGLNVEIEGRGDSDGKLVAEKIKFKDDALVMATTVNTRMKPVEASVDSQGKRIDQVETNAQRIAGQIDRAVAGQDPADGIAHRRPAGRQRRTGVEVDRAAIGKPAGDRRAAGDNVHGPAGGNEGAAGGIDRKAPPTRKHRSQAQRAGAAHRRKTPEGIGQVERAGDDVKIDAAGR